ncbi:carbamoyltransferase family protein [Nocardia sp. NPDC003979]
MSVQYVVGINIGFHDSSACLLRDGALRMMVEQERVSRRKRALAQSPADAVAACLQAEGIGPDEVDVLAIGWDFRDTAMGRMKRFGDEALTRTILPGRTRPAPPVRWVPHHIAHAASAYYSSGLEEAAVLVVDGAGERTATTIATATPAGIEIVREWPISQSLGFLYAAATRWSGFGDWGAGKLMGLAAYGRPCDDSPVRVTEDGYELVIDGRRLEIAEDDGRAVRGPMLSQFPDFEKAMLGRFAEIYPYAERSDSGEDAIAYADFAASIQNGLERAMAALAEQAARTGKSALVLAGGVAMNCSMIGGLIRAGTFDTVYVPPVPTDSGVGLGAALVVAAEQDGFAPTVIDHPYWSNDIDRDEAETALTEAGLTGRKLAEDDLAAEVAGLLAAGRILGWARGRAEIGERALGARSIIADPRSRTTLRRLNVLKGREMWRPVAPSVLAERIDEVMETPVGSPARFMLAAGRVRASMRTIVPAITHVDGTARPQLVDRRTNPGYWSMIENFRRLTGVPLVVNTSFNLAGEPIVRTAADAISTFQRCPEMDALVLGPMLVERPENAGTRTN